MHVYEELKDMLCKELEEITRKGELTAGSLETGGAVSLQFIIGVINDGNQNLRCLLHHQDERRGTAAPDEAGQGSQCKRSLQALQRAGASADRSERLPSNDTHDRR